jgi:hypothetical protein
MSDSETCPFCLQDIPHDESRTCSHCRRPRLPQTEDSPNYLRVMPELDLLVYIYGNCPVQADGRVRGNPFYFRARHDAWTFVACLDSENMDLASSIQPSEDVGGPFIDSGHRGWYASGDWQNAGWMKENEAASLICESCREFRAFLEAR